MLPDITTIFPSKTGMNVTLHNLTIVDHPIGDGWDWDVLGKLYTYDEDDPSIPAAVAVSIAVKGFQAVVASKLSAGSVVSLSGKFGRFERSASGKEKFRRIFCDIKDIELLGQVPINGGR